MPGDFFAATAFRGTAFFAIGFLGTDRLIGVAFFAVPLDEVLLFGADFAFAAFREADFRGTALAAFGRLVVVPEERRLAADFGEAR